MSDRTLTGLEDAACREGSHPSKGSTRSKRDWGCGNALDRAAEPDKSRAGDRLLRQVLAPVLLRERDRCKQHLSGIAVRWRKPLKTALVIVDMQQSLMDEGPWRADELVKQITSLVDAARAAGAPIFFVADRRVEPDPSLHPSIEPSPSDVVVEKGYCDSFLETCFDVEETDGTSFDFLGLTHVWGRSRNGKNMVRQVTAKSRFARAVAAVSDWCRKHRHWSIRDQHRHLSSCGVTSASLASAERWRL